MKFVLKQLRSNYGCSKAPTWDNTAYEKTRWFRFYSFKTALKKLKSLKSADFAICLCIPIWVKRNSK